MTLKKLFLFLSLIAFSMVTTITANAAGNGKTGMTSLNACEDAVWSNTMARRWLGMFPNPPKTDRDYLAAVDLSPWCFVSVKTNAGGHYSIKQIASNGYASEILIHKAGELNWIKANWGRVTHRCTAPYDIYEGGVIERAYRKPGPNGPYACLIMASRNGNLVHSEGVGKK